MNPLSCDVIQTSPLVMPRSLGKLALDVAQSKLRTKLGPPVALLTEVLQYCEALRTFVPCAGGL